jgi:hypothetical protein
MAARASAPRSGTPAGDAGGAQDPPGAQFVTLPSAADALDVSKATLRRWYGHRPPLVDYRREPDGRILIDLRSVPKDLVERAHRLRRDVAETVAAAEARGPMPELRRHLRWLERLVEQLQDRVVAQDAERARLLAIIERLTGQPPA